VYTPVPYSVVTGRKEIALRECVGVEGKREVGEVDTISEIQWRRAVVKEDGGW
jgi:hypothetical protein